MSSACIALDSSAKLLKAVTNSALLMVSGGRYSPVLLMATRCILLFPENFWCEGVATSRRLSSQLPHNWPPLPIYALEFSVTCRAGKRHLRGSFVSAKSNQVSNSCCCWHCYHSGTDCHDRFLQPLAGKKICWRENTEPANTRYNER